MAELSTVARPYAEALFSASKPDNIATVKAELLSLSALINNQTIQSWFKNPFINQIDQINALKIAFNKQNKLTLSELMVNFLGVLIQNKRLLLLPEIDKQFLILKNKFEGFSEAIIKTAFDLTESELFNLTVDLQKKFGVNIKPVVIIDPSLIGGIHVTVGDQVLDTSVKAQLQAMQAALVA